MSAEFEENKLKGNELFQASQFFESIKYYNNCIALEPNNPVGYSNKSMSLIKLKEYPEAVDCCQKGLEIIDKNDKNNAQFEKLREKLNYRLNMATDLLKKSQVNELESKKNDNASSGNQNVIDIPIIDVVELPLEFTQL